MGPLRRPPQLGTCNRPPASEPGDPKPPQGGYVSPAYLRRDGRRGDRRCRRYLRPLRQHRQPHHHPHPELHPPLDRRIRDLQRRPRRLDRRQLGDDRLLPPSRWWRCVRGSRAGWGGRRGRRRGARPSPAARLELFAEAGVLAVRLEPTPQRVERQRPAPCFAELGEGLVESETKPVTSPKSPAPSAPRRRRGRGGRDSPTPSPETARRGQDRFGRGLSLRRSAPRTCRARLPRSRTPSSFWGPGRA